MIDLFTPITLGDDTLPNRIFMAPLTRGRSIAGAVPNASLKAEYYSQRASAGQRLLSLCILTLPTHRMREILGSTS